jgi:3-deoxy-manno-octulosonate cytidylyltransferase (CMP-KDO synthetase)
MKKNNQIVGLIPTRLESSRLPNKALLDINGLPMIVHVALRAKLAKKIEMVFVCTDSEKITEVCLENKIDVVLTKSSHKNGTERIAEAAEMLGLGDEDIVIDIQGDEPLLIPAMIDNMVDHMVSSDYKIAVPYIKISEVNSPNRVKIVESAGKIIYLTRADAPYGFLKSCDIKKHLSIIGFRASALKHFAILEPTPLEQIEGVELLRALEGGINIGTYEEFGETLAVDTKEDYQRVQRLMGQDLIFNKYQYE